MFFVFEFEFERNIALYLSAIKQKFTISVGALLCGTTETMHVHQQEQR